MRLKVKYLGSFDIRHHHIHQANTSSSQSNQPWRTHHNIFRRSIQTIIMKITAILATASAITGTSAFVVAPAAQHRTTSSTTIFIGREEGVDLTGNTWKPDSEKMGVSFYHTSFVFFLLLRVPSWYPLHWLCFYLLRCMMRALLMDFVNHYVNTKRE